MFLCPGQKAALPEEAGYLLDRLAEMGMLVEQYDDRRWKAWFDRPAISLAKLEAELEACSCSTLSPRERAEEVELGDYPSRLAAAREYTLAARALADWCLVQFIRSSQGLEEVAVDRLGSAARRGDGALWGSALELAAQKALLPTWLGDVEALTRSVCGYMTQLQQRLVDEACGGMSTR